MCKQIEMNRLSNIATIEAINDTNGMNEMLSALVFISDRIFVIKKINHNLIF